MIRRSFVLATAGLVLLPARGFAADSVSGRFVGNGKEAKLAFASAWPRDPFSGKDTIVVVLTEKYHSAAKKPWIDAGFSKFGAALLISMTVPDAKLIGTQIVHDGLKRSGMSAVGTAPRYVYQAVPST